MSSQSGQSGRADRAHTRRPVVVGVDGSRGSSSAIRYAVQEARRLGTALRLVHVVPDYVAMTPMMPMYPSDSLTETGVTVLGRAEREAAVLAPDLVITSVLRHGSRAAELAAGAADAELLVVGRDDRSFLEHLVVGNTACGVAGRASVPVVVVPPGWDSPVEHGRVLVGVKSTEHATELLADAFETAAERGDGVAVLHAWKLPGGYDDIIESRLAAEEWSGRARHQMEELVAPLRERFPDVDVELRVVHDHPAHALVTASDKADQLVLVRRAHGLPMTVHLGGTARAVLRSTHCPVRILPPNHLLQDDEVSERPVPANA
ncbi:universal stress protein [Nocardioides taihuensis]|uniref:Universal stress protein n=1 Tax=Nocardioides taihuensis TaxID=1835606 RepID=A0ABW0BE07_9ACTN